METDMGTFEEPVTLDSRLDDLTKGIRFVADQLSTLIRLVTETNLQITTLAGKTAGIESAIAAISDIDVGSIMTSLGLKL